MAPARTEDLGILWRTPNGIAAEGYTRSGEVHLIDGEFLYVPVAQRSPYQPELWKFDKRDGRYVDRWVPPFRTGLNGERMRILDGVLYFVRRETAVHALDLSTMETLWDLEIPGGVKLDFEEVNGSLILHTGGRQVLSLDVETRKLLVLGGAPIIQTGALAINPRPRVYYDAERGETGLLSLSVAEEGSAIFLSNEVRPDGSTTTTTAFRERVPILSRPDATPFAIQVVGDFIVVNDVRAVSVHRRSDGRVLWEETFSVSSNIGDPNILGDLLLFGSDPVAARRLQDGTVVPLPAAHDNFRISHDFARRVNDHLWFGPYPFDLRTSIHLRGWQAYRGTYGDPELPFRGLPVADFETGVMYFVSRDAIHCVSFLE